jgi:hypothetical protein
MDHSCPVNEVHTSKVHNFALDRKEKEQYIIMTVTAEL